MKLATCPAQAGGGEVVPAESRAAGTLAVRFGDRWLLGAEDPWWADAPSRAARVGAVPEPIDRDVPREDLFLVVQKGRLFQREHPRVPVLLDRGRYLVVELAPEEARRCGARQDPCFAVRPLSEFTTVFATPRRAARAVEPWVQGLVDAVARSPFEEVLTGLASLTTRLSTGPGFVEAGDSLRSKLADLGYTTHFQPITVLGRASRNLIAEKLGAGAGTRDLVHVVAHLDSVNLSGGDLAPAPGADDNGSGSAGVMEIARVLKDHPGVHDLRFVLFGGEEQGLFGSKQYVRSLPSSERSRTKAVINMDMIGHLNTATASVLLEGAQVSRDLIDSLAAAASTYTALEIQTSLSPFNSDHVPFIDAGIPAVLTIEGTDGANDQIHSAHDTLDRIDPDLALEILRMNVAATALSLGKEGLPGA